MPVRNGITQIKLSDGVRTTYTLLGDTTVSNKTSRTLAAALADANARLAAFESVKTAPAAVVSTEPTIAATVKTVPTTTVKNGVVKTGTATMIGTDFEITFTTGDAEKIKATTSRATANPWYSVALLLCEKPAGFFTIRRVAGSAAKSPMTQIDAAINRCRKQGIANYGKLDAKASTDKGVWYFIRRP